MNKLRIILIVILVVIVFLINALVKDFKVAEKNTTRDNFIQSLTAQNNGGYNLYVSRGEQPERVYLRNLNGDVLYTWQLPEYNGKQKFHHVTPMRDGSILLTIEQTPANDVDYLLLDKNSKVLKEIKVFGLMSHHDSEPLDDGSILGLFLKKINVKIDGVKIPIIDDVVARVSADGEILESVSLFSLLKNDAVLQDKLTRAEKHVLNDKLEVAFDIRFKELQVSGYDFFHSNSVELLKEDIPGVAEKGDWLISVRNFNRAIIYNPKTKKIVWEYGDGQVEKPHYATIITGNRLLYFDNGRGIKQTKVIEVDMNTKEIVWQYGQKEGQEFYSDIMGGAQRLDNGNTLIMSSTEGRAFEVTPEGATVWEWIDPVFTARESPKRSSDDGSDGMFYRLHRIPENFFIDLQLNTI